MAVFVPGLAACINDRESDKAEKEFKSRYIDQQTPKNGVPATPSRPANWTGSVSAASIGGVLLIGAVAVTLLPRRRVP